jgi:hypothetical protein
MPEHDAPTSRTKEDTIVEEARRRYSTMLVLVIACLVFAILILRSPEAAQLTPEQISLLPLWGP